MIKKEWLSLGRIAFGENGYSEYAYSKDKKTLFVLTSNNYPEFPKHLSYYESTMIKCSGFDSSETMYIFIVNSSSVAEVKIELDDWGYPK